MFPFFLAGSQVHWGGHHFPQGPGPEHLSAFVLPVVQDHLEGMAQFVIGDPQAPLRGEEGGVGAGW